MLNLAIISTVLHVVGLVAAALGMRPGTQIVALEARRAYLATQPFGWCAGWAVWALCALVLVAYMERVARLGPRRALGYLALLLGTFAAAVDLGCDYINFRVLPDAARGNVSTFVFAERLAFQGGLVVANGLYSVATMVATLSLHQNGRANRAILATGTGSFLCGLVLAYAGWIISPQLVEFATGPTIGLFCIWTLLVAIEQKRLEK
jgi:hypothetical protein